MAFSRRPRSDPWSVRERMYRDVQAASGRSSRIALLTGAIAVATLLLIASYSVYQVSDEQRTVVLIERGVASITDIDTYLAETLPALREEAAAEDADLIALPGYPIDVRLSAEELRTASDVEIRDRVLRRSASQVYDEGLSAFAAEGGQSLGFLTVENAADVFLSFIRGSTHARAGIATIVFALVLAACAAVVAASDFRPGVLRAVGGAMFGASLTGLALSAALIFLVGSTAGDDVFSREVADIVKSAYAVPRRNFLVASVFSGILFGGGCLLTFLERRARPADDRLTATGAWDGDAAGFAHSDAEAALIGDADDYDYPGEAVSTVPPR